MNLMTRSVLSLHLVVVKEMVTGSAPLRNVNWSVSAERNLKWNNNLQYQRYIEIFHVYTFR